MEETKRALPVIFAFLLLGCAGCLVFSFITPVAVELIIPFFFGWRIRVGFLVFIEYMPAFLTSGILVGYALAFSKSGEQVNRWSALHIQWLRGAFILTTVLLSAYVVLSEGVRPFLNRQQEHSITLTEDYYSSIGMTRDLLAAGNLSEALVRADTAVKIWKTSADAISVRERILYEMAERSGGLDRPEQDAHSQDGYVLNPEGLTVLSALDLASAAGIKNDYYAEHYYAMLAWRLAPLTDPNRETALRRAANAWNRITEGSATLLSAADAELYRMKRDGYQALENGDYLRAYYLFNGLIEAENASGENKKDPDLPRFLSVARSGLLETSFFMDETASMSSFEAARRVFFVIRNADGTSDALYLRGITYTRAGGNDLAYLRDVEIARFDASHTLRYQISVPYVKMFPYAGSDGSKYPELILRAVHRSREGEAVGATVVQGVLPENERNVMVLDMPYDDFSILVAANSGFASMSLGDLLRISDRASRYGFSEALIQREIITRLADPFLILIVSIIVLTLGWKYRLAANVWFKAWWILVLPLLPVILMVLVSLVRYLSGLWIFVAASLFPGFALVLTLGILSALFLAASLYFFAQRSE